MRTAYFLGAGASYSLRPGFPLSSDLTIEKLIERRNYVSQSDMTIESPERGPDVITDVRRAVDDGTIPPELLSTRLEDVLDRLPPMGSSGRLRERLLFLVMKRLTLDADNSSGPLSSLLWSAQKQGDIFITTNYDTLLEWELGLMGSGHQWSPNDFVGPAGVFWLDFGIPEALLPLPTEREALARGTLGPASGSLPVLKLHGSVSWSVCNSCGLFDLDPFYKDGAADSLAGWLECSRCHRLREPVFVPPLNNKDVASNPAIKAIWDRARYELRLTNRLVFAGFSLDPSDTAVRTLLGETNGPKMQSVVVVDPGAEGEVGERFRALYGSKVFLRRESWADFLEAQRPFETP